MPGELPRLPFARREFNLTLVSYLLFAYEDRFDYEFHRESVLEFMRVTRGEARVYPAVTFKAQSSEYSPMLQSFEQGQASGTLARLFADPALPSSEFTEIETDFNFS